MKTVFSALLACSAGWLAGGTPLAGEFECDGVTPVSGDAVKLELVSHGLQKPVEATAPRGDTQRLFVVEQIGRIRIVELGTDCLRCRPFLDIRSRVSSGGERGLLGLAFHPDYEAKGLFFVYYTRSEDGATVVARYSVMASDPNRADPDSELRLLTFAQPAGNHNAGKIAFSPLDGYLYIATGDGGSGCDRAGSGNNAQNPNSLLGKLLRIDVDNPGDARQYGIPPDNPFAGMAGVRPEIWALGLRNPWRFDFDPGAADGAGKGDVYIADVGQNRWEEIDYQPAASSGGENYEWVVKEGDHSSTVSGCNPTSLTVGTPTGPIFEYEHGSGFLRGCSVTGGAVYRGCRMPDLHGTYFFADYCNGWIASFRVEEGKVVDVRDRTAELNAGVTPDRIGDISAFGVDALGRMYICDIGSPGKLFRIVPADSSPETEGSCTSPAACLNTESSLELTLSGGQAEITLDGRCSCGLSPTYRWQKASGPAGDAIESPDTASTTVTFSEAGVFVYRLTVEDGDGRSESVEATVTVHPPPGPEFVRGDSNADGSTDVSDGVHLLLYLFAGGAPPPCHDAADTNDDAKLEMADAVHTLNYLFLGGPEPPEPGPVTCGIDGTPEDSLDCSRHPPCGT